MSNTRSIFTSRCIDATFSYLSLDPLGEARLSFVQLRDVAVSVFVPIPAQVFVSRLPIRLLVFSEAIDSVPVAVSFFLFFTY